MNWFSAPWIYKKYVDEVFNVGLANKVLLEGDGRTRDDPSKQYGTGGKMQGKKFMISATWNAPREAFDNPDGVLDGGKGTADLFLRITSRGGLAQKLDGDRQLMLTVPTSVSTSSARFVFLFKAVARRGSDNYN